MFGKKYMVSENTNIFTIHSSTNVY